MAATATGGRHLFTMLPAVILLLSVIAFRIAPWAGGNETVQEIAGFSPLMAFALCGGIFLPKRLAFWFPVAAVVTTHVVINLFAGQPVVHWYAVLTAVSVAIAAVAGAAIKKKASVAVVVSASLLSTVLFHLVSNTVSFFLEGSYARSVAGWWQCQTVGLPGFLPTWVFTLRQLCGDVVFTLLFYTAFRSTVTPRPQLRAADPSPAVPA